MALDNHTLIFNLDKTFNLFNLSAKQFDTDNARSFTFQFIQNNTQFNLNGINIKVGGVKPDGKKIFNDVKIIDVENGIVELDLTSQMLAVNGVLKLEFIFMKDNIRLSSYPFEINIVPSVTNFNAIISSDEFGTLTKILNSADDTINDLTNKVNEAVTNVTANQIGGTNLLRGTKNFDYGWVLGENGVDAKIDRTNLFQGCAVEVLWYDWNYFYQDVNYEVGKTYTISCYAKADKEGANIYFSLADNMTAWGMKKITTEWKRYVFTFTPTLSTGSLRIECSGVSDNNKAYVSKIKLEKGTMATDWSSSPFDNLAAINNAPIDHDCNSFIQPNTKFIWDTGLGGFKNTPLGDLQIGSAIVFEVINYGNDGRIQQEFRQTYPYYLTRKWIRNYTSDANGVWSDWRPEFVGCGPIGQGDDFNGMTSMGCYKVQGVNGSTPNSPQQQLDASIYNYGLLTVYESGVAEEHRILQIFYPHQEGGVGHRTPIIRMKNSTAWTDWAYIGATSKDIDRLTSQIASNSSSINDLYNWANRNIQMEYISGATSLTLQPNKAYYLDGQHVADITHIDHSAIPAGGKVYFYVASGDPLAHIVFRRQGLCNQDVRVWLPKGQDFWIVGNTDGDKIFTMMKIGDAMRFLN